MARPIRETPILYGKDAERFEHAMNNVKPYSKPELESMKKAYEEFRKELIIRI